VRIETAEAQLVVLLARQVVRHDTDLDPCLQRPQQRSRSLDLLPRLHVRLAIGGGRLLDHGGVDPGDAGALEQPLEPEQPRLIQPDLLGQDAQVKALEDSRVFSLQVRRNEIGQRGMAAADRGERLACPMAVIEQGVVEIEQDGAGRPHRRPARAGADAALAVDVAIIGVATKVRRSQASVRRAPATLL
jgi:hypothetical protein